MKIRLTLKLALFGFLSALACVIANCFINLLELSIVADALWFFSYICVAIWLCKYIAKIKKVGKNLVAAFFTFAIALYSGIYYGFAEDTILSTIGELLFYVATIACLICVLVLIGRWIFGNADKNASDSNEQKQSVPEAWTCVCGATNSGKFCSECGAGKPEDSTAQVALPASESEE